MKSAAGTDDETSSSIDDSGLYKDDSAGNKYAIKWTENSHLKSLKLIILIVANEVQSVPQIDETPKQMYGVDSSPVPSVKELRSMGMFKGAKR